MKNHQTLLRDRSSALEQKPAQTFVATTELIVEAATQAPEPSPHRALNPDITIWLRLMRVHTRIAGRLGDFLSAWGLTLSQFDALAQIYADEGLRQQDLAARLMETKGNISRLLDRLQARGWLERRSEGHANRLYLTETGRALADEVIPAQNAQVIRILATLPTAERARLRALLRRLDQELRQADEALAIPFASQTGDPTHE